MFKRRRKGINWSDWRVLGGLSLLSLPLSALVGWLAHRLTSGKYASGKYALGKYASGKYASRKAASGKIPRDNFAPVPQANPSNEQPYASSAEPIPITAQSGVQNYPTLGGVEVFPANPPRTPSGKLPTGNVPTGNGKGENGERRFGGDEPEPEPEVPVKPAYFLAILVPFLILAAAIIALSTYHIPQQSAEFVAGGDVVRGKAAIAAWGCGSCHTIPGIPGANGNVGPSLQGVGSRSFIAGHLENNPTNMVQWIMHPQQVLPGNDMPEMGIPEPLARDMAAYLYTLK